MKERTKIAFLNIVISVSLSLILGAIFAIFIGKGKYIKELLIFSKFFYFLFFAGFSVTGVLLLITSIQEDLSLGFGMGLYYGTLFLCKFLFYVLDSERSELLFIAFVITALICYIVWLRNFKNRE